MAVFPELIPSGRTYSPGAYPHTAHPVYAGGEARVRHSNTVLGVRLRLFFKAITTTELLAVIAHYNGQRGRFLPFAVPDELLNGVSTPADFTPAGHQWRYAARPTVRDIPIQGETPTNRHDLTVELETVPPENTIAAGARLRVRTSIQGGSAQLGELLDVYTTIEGGQAAAQVDLLATATLDGGSPFPVVSLEVVATIEGGEFIPPADGLVATATLSGGAGSAGAEILAHVPLDIDTLDKSPFAHTVTANNGATRTGTGGPFSNGRGTFDGVNDSFTMAPSSAWTIGAEVCTLEGWGYLTSVPSTFACLAWSGSMYMGVQNVSGVARPVMFVSRDAGATFEIAPGASATTFALNGWRYMQVRRRVDDLTIFELWYDGTLVLTGSDPDFTGTLAGSTIAFGIGAFDAAGGNPWPGRAADIRFSKGQVMPTAVPTAPFPT